MATKKKKPKRDACYHKVKARYTRGGGTWIVTGKHTNFINHLLINFL